MSRARAMRSRRGRRAERRDLAADHVQPADDDGEQVVEVVRDAAGELADRFHLLRLAQRSSALRRASFWASSSRVRSLTASSERLGEGPELAIARLRSVTSTLTPTTRTGATVSVVEQISCRASIHRSSPSLGLHDAKFDLRSPARASAKAGIEARRWMRGCVLAKDALEPDFVPPVETESVQAVEREEAGRRAAPLPGLHVPLE